MISIYLLPKTKKMEDEEKRVKAVERSDRCSTM